jgi:transposase-like protein
MADAPAIVSVESEERPPCPRCGIVARVRKQGVLQRASSSIQNYRCISCEISFVDPSGRLGQGPRRNDEAREEARALRANGKTYGQIADALHISEHWAYTLCRFDFASREQIPEPKPESNPKPKPDQIILPIAGTWRIKRSLALSLSALFRSQVGCTPDQQSLDVFVSQIIENEVASFRLSHRDELMRSYGRPPMKPSDPTKEIRELTNE